MKPRQRFPYVDVFSPPSDLGPLLTYLAQPEDAGARSAQIEKRYALMDGDMLTA